ncbi:MAG TPA: hypothetical protein VNL17_10815 [Verrucomicrobiae bacterium]|nr:hypothetical protein [Verrucomicrobiae bacterium]
MSAEQTEVNRKHEVRIHIDQRPHESPNPTTAEALYKLGNVQHGRELYREVDGDHEDEEIQRNEGVVHLKEDEHFHSGAPERKHLVEVFFKDVPYELPRGVYTTEELMAKFPIEQGYLLNLKKRDGELVTLKPGEKIRLKRGMHFYSQVPGGGSS